MKADTSKSRQFIDNPTMAKLLEIRAPGFGQTRLMGKHFGSRIV
jgi:hypothetical protein